MVLEDDDDDDDDEETASELVDASNGCVDVLLSCFELSLSLVEAAAPFEPFRALFRLRCL